MDLALKVSAGKTVTIDVEGTKIELCSDNLLVTMNGLDGFAFAGEGEVGVVLDTHISEELKTEGYAREIISKLQNMRKDSGFEVIDHIKVYMAGNELLKQVVEQYKDYIMSETLAVAIVFDAEQEYTELNINGEKLMMAVQRQ
jgi:isoleucyl-tRNA synthetase